MTSKTPAFVLAVLVIWQTPASAERASEEDVRFARITQAPLLGLVLARRWTPPGEAHAILTAALLRMHAHVCGGMRIYNVEEIDQRYPGHLLRAIRGLGCATVEGDRLALQPPCWSRSGGRFHHPRAMGQLIRDYYQEADDVRRAALSERITAITRAQCDAPDFEAWCIEDMWMLASHIPDLRCPPTR